MQKKHRILVVGPMPPPLAGTSVSFKIFCDHLKGYEQVSIDIIDSAPKELGQKSLFTVDHFLTALNILWQFVRKIKNTDQVLIFANDQFLVSLVPMCLGIARLIRKPLFVRTFGGSLDTYYSEMKPLARRFFSWNLRHTDGLIVQTRLLENFFTKILGKKVHHVPGYRNLYLDEDSELPRAYSNESFRLIYISHIREEKGVFDLLESVQLLNLESNYSITCDLYGPIYSEAKSRFYRELEKTPSTEYRGVLQTSDVIPTMSRYDVLVFPSYYIGEGHPGILIEAMVSGTPVITTNFRSIPELIEHGVNGLLVSPRNPKELAEAIQLLHDDRILLAKMSERCREMAQRYRADAVVPRILKPLGITF